MNELKSGDIVCLRSGGPKMTVEGISSMASATNQLGLACVWFDNNGDLKKGVFAPEALKRDD